LERPTWLNWDVSSDRGPTCGGLTPDSYVALSRYQQCLYRLPCSPERLDDWLARIVLATQFPQPILERQAALVVMRFKREMSSASAACSHSPRSLGKRAVRPAGCRASPIARTRATARGTPIVRPRRRCLRAEEERSLSGYCAHGSSSHSSLGLVQPVASIMIGIRG
jgi:hypothetical protein